MTHFSAIFTKDKKPFVRCYLGNMQVRDALRLSLKKAVEESGFRFPFQKVAAQIRNGTRRYTTERLKLPECSDADLKNWVSPDPEGNLPDMPLEFLAAFIAATGAYWLLVDLAKACGGDFLIDEKAIKTKIFKLEREKSKLNLRKAVLEKALSEPPQLEV